MQSTSPSSDLINVYIADQKLREETYRADRQETNAALTKMAESISEMSKSSAVYQEKSLTIAEKMMDYEADLIDLKNNFHTHDIKLGVIDGLLSKNSTAIITRWNMAVMGVGIFGTTVVGVFWLLKTLGMIVK